MLSAEQLDEFDRTGIVKLPGAFSRDDAAAMCDVVWAELADRHAIDRTDPSTWDRHPPVGLKTSKKHPAFAPIFGPPLQDALHQLVTDWVRPKHFGQVLVTMPNSDEWRVPDRLWHADFSYLYPPEELFAVKYWAILDTLEAGGGATPQLAGSHRLTMRYIDGKKGDDLEYKRVRDGFLRSDPWLAGLVTRDWGRDPGRNDRFLAGTVLHGVPCRVVELTGDPGDLYLTHPWVMHSIAPNASHGARLMRSNAIWRAEFKYAGGGTDPAGEAPQPGDESPPD